ncbi:MAG: CsgG/HfaB family protein [Runella sp.]
MYLNKKFYQIVLGGLLVTIGGCSPALHQPTQSRVARLGEETAITSDLRKLPPPKEKLVAAVYKFRDQTGQYKPSDLGANWSTAVTQGATNIMLKAMEESGWFVPIERENVSNLLNERKIVRSSLTQYKSEAENLPPLLFAGIILEGGIVSYDANVITGGAGLRYFGTGGSTQYRQDRVTVYVRAVATKSGKILKSIYTSKTIFSQSTNAGIFRYVKFKRLLEAETGFTTTEPSQLAVTEAIEKSIYALIIEGIRDGLWNADEKASAQVKEVLTAYEAERNEMSQTDWVGAINNTDRPRFSIQPYGGLWRYSGDYANPLTKENFGLAANYFFHPAWGAQLNIGIGTLASQRYFYRNVTVIDANVIYRPLPFERLSPSFFAGLGMLATRGTSPWDLRDTPLYKWNVGWGLEYAFTRKVGLNVTLSHNQMMNDLLDGVQFGNFNDFYWKGTLGVSIYFGKSSKIVKKIQTKK